MLAFLNGANIPVTKYRRNVYRNKHLKTESVRVRGRERLAGSSGEFAFPRVTGERARKRARRGEAERRAQSCTQLAVCCAIASRKQCITGRCIPRRRVLRVYSNRVLSLNRTARKKPGGGRGGGGKRRREGRRGGGKERAPGRGRRGVPENARMRGPVARSCLRR